MAPPKWSILYLVRNSTSLGDFSERIKERRQMGQSGGVFVL